MVHNSNSDELWRHIKALERELDEAQQHIVDVLPPDELSPVLSKRWQVKTDEELDEWLAVAESAVCDFAWERSVAEGHAGSTHCPLCRQGRRSFMPGDFGYLLPDGLLRHLRGTHQSRRCFVMKAAESRARHWLAVSKSAARLPTSSGAAWSPPKLGNPRPPVQTRSPVAKPQSATRSPSDAASTVAVQDSPAPPDDDPTIPGVFLVEPVGQPPCLRQARDQASAARKADAEFLGGVNGVTEVKASQLKALKKQGVHIPVIARRRLAEVTAFAPARPPASAPRGPVARGPEAHAPQQASTK